MHNNINFLTNLYEAQVDSNIRFSNRKIIRDQYSSQVIDQEIYSNEALQIDNERQTFGISAIFSREWNNASRSSFNAVLIANFLYFDN